MIITLFGASGSTGRLVLEQCLQRGWSCRAFVRDASKLEERAGVETVEGDARSLEKVRAAIKGADAVFCCLGMSDIASANTEFSDGVKTIVRAMRETGVKRLVAIASVGVLDHPDGGYRAEHGLPDYLKYVAAEHIRNLQTLRASGLEWTLMCPPYLRDDIPPGNYRFEFESRPEGSSETAYADLAVLMVELVNNRDAIGKRVGIVSINK